MSLAWRSLRRSLIWKRPLSVRYQSGYPTNMPPNRILQEQHVLRTGLERFIQKQAARPVPTVALNDLLKFNSAASHRDKSLMLVENANETLNDMVVLVTRRLIQFMKLPYIVVLNAKIADIYTAYLDTLKVILEFVAKCDPASELTEEFTFKIQNLEQNDLFLQMLKKTIDIHTDNLSILSEGFEEISGLNLVDDKTFLNDHLKERILMRLLANHHIQLTEQLNYKGEELERLDQIGMIEPNMNVLEVLHRSFAFVNDMVALKYDEKIQMNLKTVIINGDDTTTEQIVENFESPDGLEPLKFPYISSHIEYVLNEIFKNSARAHIENGVKKPVDVLIVVNKPNVEKPGPQFYKLEMRVGDHGLGIKPEVLDKLFDYSFTTFESEAVEEDSYKTLNNTGANQANIIAGMGYGLPLSLTYNRLFNGDIELKSVYGQGTTVYLKWVGVDAKQIP
ncbi:hypothetical protein KL930_001966 [Ogataea haglerorum]|nr:uncharacterized protein KL911_001907 [Ogataea haglerorum]KAG7708526.1 hypothetical protein KL914_002252 [Ogataea haglerorum]KAG7755850.1 hypothetical protein KL911_001907 [Ogataea haglerorum]KAG7781044.1 hypothetical protein KL930_001966 [Ogataea haglerorum]KAG7799402.1 hypothetical protein KL929_001479 [Ogataea haglerorum]KAG7803126.1 hypothetical protein KL944_002018 [Ogataea haglerorum]